MPLQAHGPGVLPSWFLACCRSRRHLTCCRLRVCQSCDLPKAFSPCGICQIPVLRPEGILSETRSQLELAVLPFWARRNTVQASSISSLLQSAMSHPAVKLAHVYPLNEALETGIRKPYLHL
ncbi:uncharacterized protein BDV17DRAFT_270749 [Aspergillus undulatus]|uniref:uncharacterized protein n=1 Tax=Aspergillus undulatus TaxID=1810928 RepID=UPI003CCD7450